MTLRVQILKDKFNQSLGLPFQELLPYSAIEKALWELKMKYKKRLFDPIVTLWAFLSQVLDTDKSCHNAVSKIIAYLTGEGVEIPSLRDAPRTTDTSAYCQARSRLPEKLLKNLLMWSAGNSYGTPPLRLSLQGTRHHLNNFIPQLLAAHNTKRLEIYRTLLKVIVHKTVSDLLKAAALRYRPGRSEPRVRKRRPKAYPLMTKPRRELRKQLQTA